MTSVKATALLGDSLRGVHSKMIRNVGFVLQARGVFLQLVLIYLIVCLVPLSLGTYLLLAPRRGGNFLNDAFAIFPHVEPGDRLKNLFYRALGLGLIAVSSFYVHQIYLNIAVPLARFFRNGR